LYGRFFLAPVLVYATEESEPVVSQSWLNKAIENIQKEEYKPSLQKSDYKGKLFEAPKYHFANRSNNLRAYFDENEMELISRVITDEENWNFKIKSIAVGNNHKSNSGGLEVSLDGDNIKCESDGIEIIYSNSEIGIEQDIIIKEKSEIEGIDFIIETENLDVSKENYRFVLSGNEDEIIYQINKIEDAEGKELFYSLSKKENKLSILLDNEDVVYPIKINTNISSTSSSAENSSISLSAKTMGLSETPDWMFEVNRDTSRFGHSVSGAGDVNGDGYSDVIVGAYKYDNGEYKKGMVFVFYGSSSGLSDSWNWRAEYNADGINFGSYVSTAGDVNGDGYSDVIVGAYRYDNEEEDEGAAFVYHGSSSGLSATVNWSAESDQDSTWFGGSVSTAGDVNGDGYSDVIVGAQRYDNGEQWEGGAFLYHGSPSGLSASHNWMYESNRALASFGYSVSSAGDVNGDGYSDVIVGAPDYGNGESFEGMAFVYRGSSSGLSVSYDWTAESDLSSASFGSSVSSAGDVNGDGYSDVIVGAYGYDNGETNEGRVFVYHGSSSGLSDSADWSAESDQEWARFGFSVSGAGDVNGDGYSDVIVGARHYDNVETDEGAAFVYHGNGSGLSLIPTQATTDGSRLVQLGNAMGSEGVKLNILGRTPGGREKVKLQWEVKELGQLFDGTSISESGSWYDTDTNGIEISEDVIGLDYATAYHWRVRLKYDPVTYNDAIYSRWLSIGPNGWNETDFITTDVSGIEDNTDSGSNIKLSVFPTISTNIFSIKFYISEEEAKNDISLKVYNKAGIMVKNLFTGKKPAGIHTMKLNGDKLPSDIYFISLKKGKSENLVRKIVLLR
jgi:hypothetical protein